jgi:hypothetical protein
MERFIPVIREHPDGSSSFCHKLVRVEFPHGAAVLTRMFEIEEAAPVIPFRKVGLYHQRVYVVDHMGVTWLEDRGGTLMVEVSPFALASGLKLSDDADAPEVYQAIADGLTAKKGGYLV